MHWFQLCFVKWNVLYRLTQGDPLTSVLKNPVISPIYTKLHKYTCNAVAIWSTLISQEVFFKKKSAVQENCLSKIRHMMSTLLGRTIAVVQCSYFTHQGVGKHILRISYELFTECWGNFNSRQFAYQKFLQNPFLECQWSVLEGKRNFCTVGSAT